MRLSFAFLFVLLVSTQLISQTRVPDYTITSMKAMLFYDNKGTLSDDVSEAELEPFVVPSKLWNTPMEGASREGASSSVLVTVEVSGEYAAVSARKIDFTARYTPIEGRREIVVRKSAPIWIRENGKYVAGFWLDLAGCNPVRLTARIVGQRKPSFMRRFIRFGCGE
jgi:hypothetical protein